MAFIHCAELLGVVPRLLPFSLQAPQEEAPVEATIRCSTTGAIIHKPA
jgi:hypothetical protein